MSQPNLIYTFFEPYKRLRFQSKLYWKYVEEWGAKPHWALERLWKTVNKFIDMDTEYCLCLRAIMRIGIFDTNKMWSANDDIYVFSIDGNKETVSTPLMRPLCLVLSTEGRYCWMDGIFCATPNACKHRFRVMSTKNHYQIHNLNWIIWNETTVQINKQTNNFGPFCDALRLLPNVFIQSMGVFDIFVNAFKSIPIPFRLDALIAFPRHKCWNIQTKPRKKFTFFLLFLMTNLTRSAYVCSPWQT